MALIRVPYPSEPERRQALFDRALAKLAGFGSCDGDPDAGTFRGSTPIGEVAGRYHAPPGAVEIEIEVFRKPFLVPLSLIESEARRFVAKA